jgi:alkylation response protein AidB-like acyl-CoA dehydrogenase
LRRIFSAPSQQRITNRFNAQHIYWVFALVTGVDHGLAWPLKIVPAKYHAVEACWKIVDLAMEISGGAPP